ncbi:hypothetical protein JCM10135_09560 [Stetteria hydrogenophila]
MEATRYYMLGRLARMGLAACSIVVLATSALILWLHVKPLYTFRGLLVHGEVGLVRYRLSFAGGPLEVPVLDSINRLSFILIHGSILSSALVAPALVMAAVKPRIARVYLEIAAAGNVVGGLTTALLMSFLRVLYTGIIPSIPVTHSIPTTYGVFTFYGSSGWYTEAGLLSLRLWPLYPVIVGVEIGSAIAIVYHLFRYYEEVLELPPIPVSPT